MPVALKDNLCTRGVRTTASSRILESFVPPYDATVVSRLEAAGAVVVGKTNCDEFAMGSSTENSAFGPTRNPWALDRIPGGSSGGSAVAVAAGMAPLALGSDTGGSIRQPAALCGIVGLKPTYGRVSRYGLLAFASSLDQIGPLARTVGDAAIALSVIAGADPADATSAPEPVPDYSASLDRRRARRADRRAVAGCSTAASTPKWPARCGPRSTRWSARGATLVDVELPHAGAAIPVYYLVATAEASSNLARYDGVRYGFRADGRRAGKTICATMYATHAGAGLRRRGQAAHHARHLRAQRRLLRRVLPEGAAGAHADPARLRAGVRATSTSWRCRRARCRRSGSASASPIRCRCIWWTSSPSARTSQVCRRSACPAGSRPDRLPIGLQLTGRPFDEATLLRVADAYERDTGWWRKQPPADSACQNPSGRRGRTSSCSRCACAISGCRSTAPTSNSASAQVNAELEARGLALPHYWLSDEWFTPDGIPGVAIPFYLAHPRLAKLELAQMLEVEGGDPESCLMILRHEAGHAIDNAYQLRRRPTRRRLFGNPHTPYPEYYTPKPYSKSFVQHLDHWYAQSHPDEDFAETFAVWLDPASMWATRYAGWPAQRKLEYMDRLMRELARTRPRIKSKREVDPLPRMRKTLREHYSKKREHYGLDHPDFYESDLRNLFSDAPEYAKNPSAARFVRRVRKEVRSTVASFTDSYQYTIDQLLETIIERCRELNLRLTESEEATKIDFMVFLTVQTMNYLHSGRHRVAL